MTFDINIFPKVNRVRYVCYSVPALKANYFWTCKPIRRARRDPDRASHKSKKAGKRLLTMTAWTIFGRLLEMRSCIVLGI